MSIPRAAVRDCGVNKRNLLRFHAVIYIPTNLGYYEKEKVTSK